MKRATTARPILFWMAFVFSAAAIFQGYQSYIDWSVSRTQLVAQGVVQSEGRWNHGQTYNYVFYVGPASFRGNSPAPRAGTYEIGQAVPVYYDPRRPERNALTPFSRAPDLIPTLAAACFAAGAVWFGLRKRPRSPSATS